MTTVYWTRLAIENWPLIIAATEKGLCFVGGLDDGLEELSKWQQRKFPTYMLQQNEGQLKPYSQWFEKYFNQEFIPFSLPIDLVGTEFHLKVWRVLLQIPFGETKSYSDIAEMILQPSAVRAVGGAIGANPIAIVIPCHRVIGKNKSLTGYRGGIPMKIRLLKNENIIL